MYDNVPTAVAGIGNLGQASNQYDGSQKQAAYATAATNPRKQGQITEEVFAAIGNKLQAISVLNSRFSNGVDRLSGSQPQEVGKDQVAPSPITLVAKLHLIDSVLGHLERELRSNIERMENVV